MPRLKFGFNPRGKSDFSFLSPIIGTLKTNTFVNFQPTRQTDSNVNYEQIYPSHPDTKKKNPHAVISKLFVVRQGLSFNFKIRWPKINSFRQSCLPHASTVVVSAEPIFRIAALEIYPRHFNQLRSSYFDRCLKNKLTRTKLLHRITNKYTPTVFFLVYLTAPFNVCC
jgi:hypothetical protein